MSRQDNDETKIVIENQDQEYYDHDQDDESVEQHSSPRKPHQSGYVFQDDNDGNIKVCEGFIIGLSWFLLIITFPITIFFCFSLVQEYERAVIFRLGRIKQRKAVGPGLFFVLPCVDSVVKADLRTISFDVRPQEILTKDSVTVAVDAVVYYAIKYPLSAVCRVQNYSVSTKLLASTTLRTILGTRNLSEILSDREGLSNDLEAELDAATDPWGIKVERVEVKDVRLPVQLQRAMAAEAEATREASAKIIAAEGEREASVALQEAAAILSETPSAIQLRYMQTLNNIAAEKNSTIIFPLPMELLPMTNSYRL